MVRTPCFHRRAHGFDPWSRELRSRKPCSVAKNKQTNKKHKTIIYGGGVCERERTEIVSSECRERERVEA